MTPLQEQAAAESRGGRGGASPLPTSDLDPFSIEFFKDPFQFMRNCGSSARYSPSQNMTSMELPGTSRSITSLRIGKRSVPAAASAWQTSPRRSPGGHRASFSRRIHRSTTGREKYFRRFFPPWR